jgi:hypothetical protein
MLPTMLLNGADSTLLYFTGHTGWFNREQIL